MTQSDESWELFGSTSPYLFSRKGQGTALRFFDAPNFAGWNTFNYETKVTLTHDNFVTTGVGIALGTHAVAAVTPSASRLSSPARSSTATSSGNRASRAASMTSRPT